MPKLKDKYIIGWGYPEYYKSGLDEGVYFYSDTDTRLSNTRDTNYPSEINSVHRSKRPQYELVLRRIKRGNTKRRKAKRTKERKTNRKDGRINKTWYSKTWRSFLKFQKRFAK